MVFLNKCCENVLRTTEDGKELCSRPEKGSDEEKDFFKITNWTNVPIAVIAVPEDEDCFAFEVAPDEEYLFRKEDFIEVGFGWTKLCK